jgi:hypothetical protein
MERYNPTPELKIGFEYPSFDDPMLAELRDIAKVELDRGNSELEKARAVIGYAHGLFTHNGDNTPSSSDPLTIIKEAQSGKSFRCVEYSLLATALLWAHGIPARTVGLKTSDVETREYGAGHVVIEFWDSELNKWIMSDVQAGIIPTSDNKPLSAVELEQNMQQAAPLSYLPVQGSRFGAGGSFADMPAYEQWLKEYLYFFDTPVHTTFADVDRREEQIAMLVPLGVASPKMFQNMFEMNAVYTHSVADFYAEPTLGK